MDRKLHIASILDTLGFGERSSGRAKAYFRAADKHRREAKKGQEEFKNPRRV